MIQVRRAPPSRSQAFQVARGEGRDVGVYHRRGRALVFPVFGQQQRREGDTRVRPAQGLGHPLLVVARGVGVQQDHGHALHAFDPLQEPGQLLVVQRFDFVAVRIQAAGQAKAVLSGHERGFAMPGQRIELGPVLPADFDHVLEAPVGDQGDSGSPSLQQCVGGYGGSMQQQVRRFVLHDLRYSPQHRLGRVCRSRRDLQGAQAPVFEQQDVREGATGIDSHHPG